MVSSDNNALTPVVTLSFCLRVSFRCSRSSGVKNGSPGSSSSSLSSHSLEVKNCGAWLIFSVAGEGILKLLGLPLDLLRQARPMLLKDLITSLQSTLFFVRNTCRGCLQSMLSLYEMY